MQHRNFLLNSKIRELNAFFLCDSPVSGEEKNRGHMVHHELPGKVITSNIHPTRGENAEHVFPNEITCLNSTGTKTNMQTLYLATAMVPFPCNSLASWMMMWLRTEQNPHH